MKELLLFVKGKLNRSFAKMYYNLFHFKKHLPSTSSDKKSGGGLVVMSALKKQIENHLVQDKEAFVTTFFDYYGIHDKHVFPDWEVSKKVTDKSQRMSLLRNFNACGH
jgi:hypothetical protein